MHTQRVLFLCKKLPYLSLFQFSGKEMPQENLFETAPTQMWCMVISALIPLIETSSRRILQLICIYLNSFDNSFDISNMHHIKNLQFSESSLVIKPMKHEGFILMNPWSVNLFFSFFSILPNLIGFNLSEYPYFLHKFNIRNFFLRLYFRCIR